MNTPPGKNKDLASGLGVLQVLIGLGAVGGGLALEVLLAQRHLSQDIGAPVRLLLLWVFFSLHGFCFRFIGSLLFTGSMRCISA